MKSIAWLSCLLATVVICDAATSPNIGESLRVIRAVGPEGQGNGAASSAWKDLAASDVKALPRILGAMDGANDLALNWLRSAIETIVSREVAGGRELPVADLEKFVRDTKHHPRARRLGYELIARADAPAAERLLAGMLDDPAPELRRDAVEKIIIAAGNLRTNGSSADAIVQYQAALRSARDVDQIENIAKALKQLGQPASLPSVFGWLADWKVIGPFDNTTNAGFERAFPPEQKVDLDAEYDGKAGKVRWQDVKATGDYGLVDLNKPCGALKSVAGYAYTEFHAAKAGPAQLRLGSKNGWKLWLNGQYVFGRDEYHRGAEIDQYRMPVELKRGKNTVLVKVTQNELVEDWTKEWEFQLRITDALGTPVASAKTLTHTRMKQFLCSLTLLAALNTWAEDWPQFRGPRGNGISLEKNLPGNLEPGNIAWSADLPGRGLSSPIIVGDRVIVTCSSGPKQERLHVICFNVNDGTKRWERQFWATGRTMSHEKTSVAAPTPASDGERIFAIFSSNDLLCLDLDGNLLWLRGLTRDYPNASNSLGMSSSLATTDGVVIAMLENDSDSTTVGLDAKTGVNRWKIARPKMANWTSPVLVKAPSGATHVVLQSGKGLSAVDPLSGKTIWEYTDGASTIPSSTLSEGVLFVPSHGLTALRPGSEGENKPTQLWRSAQLRPGTSSPLVLNNRVFILNDGGVLTCGDAASGERLWQLRLKGPFSATPVGAGNLLYCVNEKGLLQVVDITQPEGAVVSEFNLARTILSTPSIAHGGIFVRSDGKLWRLAERQQRSGG